MKNEYWRPHVIKRGSSNPKLLVERLGAFLLGRDEGHYEVSGPFGICSAFMLKVRFKSRTKKDRWAQVEVDPEPGSGGVRNVISIRRVDKPEEDRYKKGTIGEINGLNFELERLDPKLTRRQIFNRMCDLPKPEEEAA